MQSSVCPSCFAVIASGEICSWCGANGSLCPVPGDTLPRGTILRGNFKIGRLLGRGGFGATYLAWDEDLHARVCIKEHFPREQCERKPDGIQIGPRHGSEPAFQYGLEQFLSEARNLAQFRGHPGIISVFQFFPENGTGYMVMEYLDGSTVEDRIADEGRLEWPVAVKLVFRVADALRACHSVGLIHRDISPDNIFVTSDGLVKVLDFGAARNAIGQTKNLTTIYKEGYAPLEQQDENAKLQQGPWTDIYALTATLYRLLTGEMPPTVTGRLAALHKERNALNEEPPVSARPRPSAPPVAPISEKGIETPERLQDLLDKGMAIFPDQRYQDVEAFLADLQAILGHDDGLTSSTEQQPIPPSPSRRKILVVVFVAAIGLAGVLAVSGVIPTSWRPMPPPKTPTPETGTPVTQTPETPTPVTLTPVTKTPVHQDPALSLPIAKEHVKQAAVIPSRLKRLQLKISKAREALDRLYTLPGNSPVILKAISVDESVRDEAMNILDADYNKYMAQVAFLANYDKDLVKVALQDIQEEANSPSMDNNDAKRKAALSRALDLLKEHIGAYRRGNLTREKVLADVLSRT